MVLASILRARLVGDLAESRRASGESMVEKGRFFEALVNVW